MKKNRYFIVVTTSHGEYSELGIRSTEFPSRKLIKETIKKEKFVVTNIMELSKKDYEDFYKT